MQAERIPVTLPLPQGAPRSAGVHLSSLIRCMAADYGILKKEWVEDLSLVEVLDQTSWWNQLDEPSRLRMSIGLAWENWYLPQIPGVVHQPGELEVEGVYMTPDGTSLDVVATQRGPRHELVVHECKATYKSVNTVGDLNAKSPETWMWRMQILGYCVALDTLVAYLHILYLCGDYKFPIQPQLHIWRIAFSQDERDEAWQLMMDYRQAKQSLGGA